MKRSRETEERMVAISQEHELGAKPADPARERGISEAVLDDCEAKTAG